MFYTYFEQMIFTIINILLCFSLAFLCFVSKQGKHTYYLGFFFCIVSIYQLFSLPTAKHLLAYVPILWVPETLMLLAPPLLVCYVRSMSGFANHLYTKCLLIPSGLYLKAFSYFYVAGYVTTESFHKSGLFYGGVLGTVIFSCVAAIWILVWISKYQHLFQPSSFYWTYGLLTFVLVYSILAGVSHFYNIEGGGLIQQLIDVTMFVFLAMLLISGLRLLLTKTIISIKEEKSWEVSIADMSLQVTTKKELCPKLREAYANRIREALEVKKIYLGSKVTLSQLAKSTDMSPHDLSYVVNNEWNLNFNELLNTYRVNEAKQLLQDEKYDNATMFAIAIDAGFNSESSFYTVFKKITGKSPKRYRDTLKSTSEL
jgi:AraC-like DNA-binding protein